MANEFTLSVGQAHELEMACNRNGQWTPELMKKLSTGDILARVREVLLGHATISTVKHVIDCDADPFLPDGLTVVEHRKGGQFEWDPSKVALYLSPNQMDGKVVEGNKLRKELVDKLVINANFLDYLLAHPELIPNEWKGKVIFFWGTIYRDSGGRLYVRYLCWNGSGWRWCRRWLVYVWYSINPAAVLAS